MPPRVFGPLGPKNPAGAIRSYDFSKPIIIEKVGKQKIMGNSCSYGDNNIHEKITQF